MISKKTKTFKFVITERFCFTLIEIMVCIALLALIGGLLTYKGKSLINRSQEITEISNLKKTIDLAKTLSLSYHTDVELDLIETTSGIHLEMKSDEEAVKKTLELFNHKTFSHLKKLETNQEEPSNQIHLVFSSTGWTFPDQEIKILGKRLQ